MIEQPQTKLKEAEIAPLIAMDDLFPAVPQGVRSEVDDPEVGKRCGDQESAQTRRVREVALVQMKSSAFLIREQCLNLEPLPIPTAGFFSRGHVRDEMDRLFAVSSPPGDGEKWSVPALREECAWNIKNISRGHVITHVSESKFLPLPSQCRGLARPQSVLPSGLSNE